MPQVQKQKTAQKIEEPEVQDTKGIDADTEDLDALLDEIDSVLEINAAAFVENYVQKGGE